MTQTLLGVNIDHIATLRNARTTLWPDPIHAAFIAEQSGANSITVHIREDRRHITDRDVYLLRKTIQTRMNLEMAVTDEMIAIASDLIPYSCCLVPEARQELTTESGLDIITQSDKLHKVITYLQKQGILVSLFVDPNPLQIKTAAKIGASHIEIHTGNYANATNSNMCILELNKIKHCVQYASELNLKISAGHGLNYNNVKSIAALPQIEELNIGHAIIARSVLSGLAKAVHDMKYLVNEACCN